MSQLAAVAEKKEEEEEKEKDGCVKSVAHLGAQHHVVDGLHADKTTVVLVGHL